MHRLLVSDPGQLSSQALQILSVHLRNVRGAWDSAIAM
jgi:hypothetical protein